MNFRWQVFVTAILATQLVARALLPAIVGPSHD
jgi:hypothetical protein